jgi:4-hydroxybenzoyl-CoA reductase subunit beta
MLPLPELTVVHPETVEEAVALLSEAPAKTMLLSGGTDLLPNLKHGLAAPRRLVSLRRLAGLREIRPASGGGLTIGAGVTLAALADHPQVRARYPALAQAAGGVAGPQLRNMGTLGGNLCLDTRCVYFNQTAFWRGALGYCLKKDGDRCHVVPEGSRCVAAMSADTPAPLIAYGASVRLVSARGDRTIPVGDFFRGDGARNTVREPDEILTEVTLPAPPPGLRSGYRKLRVRQAIDFPILSVAAAAMLDKAGLVTALSLVVGALGARPKTVQRLEKLTHGRTLDDALARAIAEEAHRQCHPLANLNVDSAWRREMVRVEVRRLLGELVASRSA